MAYNYSKLKGRIVEICVTRGEFARRMGFSERTLSLKLNNNVMFKQDEITRATEILEVPTSEILVYFFQVQVR